MKEVALSIIARVSEAVREWIVQLQLSDLALQIKPSGDGFLKKIMPEKGARAEFDLLVGYSSKDGMFFGGSAALETTIPIHKAIGPINLDSLYLGLLPEGSTIPFDTAISFRAKLGPILATIEKTGIDGQVAVPKRRA